jgi:DNA-binding FadR family transcriptional regulator
MSSDLPPKTRAPDRAAAIAGVLQGNILSGHYAPGDRLPSEADLCAHFKVSRPTLREALGRLTARGLISARRGAGGGAFVTRMSADAAGEQIAALVGLGVRLDGNAHRPFLTEARIQLQLGCAELAILRRADIADLRAEIDLQSDFGIDDAAFSASVRRMHLALAAASGNPALTMLAQGLVQAEYALVPDTAVPTRVRARFLSYHVRLANGIAAGRSEDARAALLDLWRFEADVQSGSADAVAQVERPPKMRDLRLPPVQRLTPSSE